MPRPKLPVLDKAEEYEKANKPKVKTKSKGTKPLKELPWDVINELAALHCTPGEIHAFLNKTDQTIHYNTLDQHTKRNFNMSFGQYITTVHDASAKPKLRKLQWKAAEKGNATLLIWLGKQYLGQVDRQEIEQTNYNMPTLVIDDTKDEE